MGRDLWWEGGGGGGGLTQTSHRKKVLNIIYMFEWGGAYLGGGGVNPTITQKKSFEYNIHVACLNGKGLIWGGGGGLTQPSHRQKDLNII